MRSVVAMCLAVLGAGFGCACAPSPGAGATSPGAGATETAPAAADPVLIIHGSETVGPWRVRLTSPAPPAAGEPATLEVDITDAAGTQVQSLDLTLEIRRVASSSVVEEPAVSIPMSICPGCGSYRVDTTLDAGRYALAFTAPLPDSTASRRLEFALDVR